MKRRNPQMLNPFSNACAEGPVALLNWPELQHHHEVTQALGSTD